MDSRVEASLVRDSATVREAMAAIDRGADRIALVVDPSDRLVGVVTDGDVRRAILRGTTLDDPIAPVMTRRFVAVGPRDGRAEALDLIRARRIDAIPVVDDEGRPVGLHLLHGFLQPRSRTNAALVMAGGRGVRLQPLTDSVPKPMLRVAGRPILERIVLHLVGFGITRIHLAVGYLGHVIEDHFGDGSRFGCRIEYLREDEPLGTAGALGLLPEPPSAPLLVLNGDLVTTADLGGMLDQHDATRVAATLGTRRYAHEVPFGCIERDGDRVTAFVEKPSVEREVSAGIYVLDPRVVALVPRGRRIDMPDLVDEVLGRGWPVGAFPIEDDWVDVGQREQLARARQGG